MGSRPFHAGLNKESCRADHLGLIPTFASGLGSGWVGSTSPKLWRRAPARPCFASLAIKTFRNVFSSSSEKLSPALLIGGLIPTIPRSITSVLLPPPGEEGAPVLNNKPAAPLPAFSTADTPLPLPFCAGGFFFFRQCIDLCPVPLQ